MSKPVQDRLRYIERLTQAISATTTALNQFRHGQRLLRLSIAATQTLNLPKATGKGGRYRIFSGITASGNKVIKANGTDLIQGLAVVSGGTSGSFSSAADTNTITMNGTTQGGIIGSLIELQDAAPGVWSVVVHSVGSGVAVTPFSNT